MSVSAKEIIDEVLFKLNQNPRDPLALSRVKVMGELNNCLVDLAENTRMFPTKAVITLEVGTSTYALPVDFVEIINVTNSDWKELKPTTLASLQNYSWYWQNESGTPEWYILDFDTPNTIRFFQTPSADWDDKVLDLVYYQYPAKILYESVEIPTPLLRNKKMLVDYCLAQLYQFQMEVMNAPLGQQYWGAYLQERNKWAKKSINPPRLLIMGSLGKVKSTSRGPNLPDNYPSLWD